MKQLLFSMFPVCRCRNVVLKDRRHRSRAWCDDFLTTGGATGKDGSCCKTDGALYYGWCQQVKKAAWAALYL
jgi:hypothetical protein